MTAGGGRAGSYYGLILRDLRVWSLCFACMGGSIIYIGAITWIPTCFVLFAGLSEVYAGSIASLIALTGIVAAPLQVL